MDEKSILDWMNQSLENCINSCQPCYVGEGIESRYPDGQADIQAVVKKEDFSKKFDFMDCVNFDNAIINLFMEFYFEKYNENIMGQIADSKLRKIYETEFVDWLYKGF